MYYLIAIVLFNFIQLNLSNVMIQKSYELLLEYSDP